MKAFVKDKNIKLTTSLEQLLTILAIVIMLSCVLLVAVGGILVLLVKSIKHKLQIGSRHEITY